MSESFSPFAAHVLLLALVYGSLLLVIHVAYRGGSHSSAREQLPVPRQQGSDNEEETAALLPAMPPLAAGFEDDDEELTEAEEGLGAQPASGPSLDRISAQLDYALSSPSVYKARPREMLSALRQAQSGDRSPSSDFHQEAAPGYGGSPSGAKDFGGSPSGAKDFGGGSTRKDFGEEDDELELQRLQDRRWQEVIRKREAKKREAAEAARGPAGSPSSHTGPQSPISSVHVSAAPMDAVYGAEPTNPAPEAAGPSASLPLSPEERIMAMHVRGSR
jgi:hypothetical protein